MTTETTTPTAITIRIGSVTKGYLLFTTTAPSSFDGFGTLTLYGEDGETRWVLVESEHVGWQANLNASGLYSLAPNDDFNQRDLELKFLARLAFTKEG